MIRIGFIGCGGIAREYRSRLAQIPAEAQVVAVCDLDAGRARDFAGDPDAAVYTDYREMLARERLDAIFDCLPPFARGEEIARAAERGCAIFTTKPLGLEMAVAARSLAAIEAAGVLSSVGYMFRYSGIVDEARRLLAGRPVAMLAGQVYGAMPGGWYAQRAMSGGQIVEQSTHIIDLTRYLAGEVRQVYALGRAQTVPDRVDYDDVSSVTLDFADGAVGTVLSTCAVWQFYWGCTIIARDVHLELVFDDWTLRGRVDGRVVEYRDDVGGYQEQINAFVRAVRTGDPSLIRCTYRDGAGTLATTLAAVRSSETGQPEIIMP